VIARGGKSTVDGVGGNQLNNLGVGFTLGYQITGNLSLTAGYMATVNDNDPGDMSMDVFRFSIVVGWHNVVEGMERLKGDGS
jgi:hypothetical protein